MKKTTLLFAQLLLVCFAVSTVFAQVPRSFSYQGFLLDAAKAPVTGIHQIKVVLYDAPVGGSILHSEVFSTPVVGGVFSVIIGSQTALGSQVAFDKQYWIGLSVDNLTELMPRTALTSIPYALRTETATTAVSFSGTLAGDISGSMDKTFVNSLQGNALNLSGIYAPSAEQVLSWNIKDMAWEPKMITNSMMQNSSISINYGFGISGDPTVTLGGTLNLNNLGVHTLTGKGLITTFGEHNVVVSFTTGGNGQVLMSDGENSIWNSLTRDPSMVGNGTTIAFGLDLAHDNNWTGLQTFPNGSISNAELASPNIYLTYGSGISGNSSVVLGSALTLTNTGVITISGSGLLTTSGGQNPTIGFTTGLNGQLLTSDGLNSTWNNLSRDLTLVGNGTTAPFGVDVTHPNLWIGIQTFPDASITNTELANSNILVNYGSGISGDASVVLGNTLNIHNTGILSVTGSGLITSSGGQDPVIGFIPGLNGEVLTSIVGEGSSSLWTMLSRDNTMVGNGTTTPFGIDLTHQNTWLAVQTFPTGSITNEQLQFDGVTINSGTGTIGGGYLGLGGTMTLDVNIQHDLSLVGNGSDAALGIRIQHDATLTGDGDGNSLSLNLDNANSWNQPQTFPNGSITNSELANSGMTINTGTGLSGGATVTLGGNMTVDANIQHNLTLTGNGTTDNRLAIDLTNMNIWSGAQMITGVGNFAYTGNGEADGYVLMSDAIGVASWKPVSSAATNGVLKESYTEVTVGESSSVVIPDGYTVVVLLDAIGVAPFDYIFPSGVNGQKLYIYNLSELGAQNVEFNVVNGTMTQFIYAHGAWKHIVN